MVAQQRGKGEGEGGFGAVATEVRKIVKEDNEEGRDTQMKLTEITKSYRDYQFSCVQKEG